MDRPLEEPLPELRRSVRGVDREVAEEVRERKGEPEARDDGGCAREPAVVPREPLERPQDQEPERENVGEADVARDVPVDLLERDAEDRREEQEAGDPHPARLRISSASSSTRVSRARRVRSSGASGVPSRSPARQRACSPWSASRMPATSSGRDDDAGAGLADQLGGCAVRRHDGEDRPLGGEVLEDLPGEHPAPAAAGLGDQEQERLRVALELERAAPGDVGDQLQPVAELERLRPLGVGRAEVADETDDGVVEAGLRERGQERPRVALAEEAARVGDPQAVGRPVLDAVEIVEVRAVRDRHHPAARLECARLVRDRVGRGHDRVRVARNQTGDPVLALLLQPGETVLGAAVRVGDE